MFVQSGEGAGGVGVEPGNEPLEEVQANLSALLFHLFYPETVLSMPAEKREVWMEAIGHDLVSQCEKQAHRPAIE